MSKGNGHKTETPDVSHIRNVEVTHETSDINVNAVLTFVLILSVSTVAVYFAMAFMFSYFKKKDAEPPRGTMALKKEERLPPGPRLQGAPGFEITLENGQKVNLELTEPQAEYKVLAEQWDKALKGELKDQSGTASMAIEQAIKQIAAQGLPTSPDAKRGKLADSAVQVPTAASSGRLNEKVVSHFDKAIVKE